MKPWVWLTVSWFGVSGKFPFLRGTWGTLATLPFAFAVQYSMGDFALTIAGCFLFALGVVASDRYVAETGKEDPGEIVIDEAAAICMLLALMPFSWQSYLTGFLVFRVFDVVKPWPVSVADKKIKGGFGVMFDDVLAALYPVGIMAALASINPPLYQQVMAWLQPH